MSEEFQPKRQENISDEECLKLRDSWFAEADAATLETTSAFLQKLAAHEHDYTSRVHAIAAAAVAAAKSVAKHQVASITGEQAGGVMWQFIMRWFNLEGHDLRLLDFDQMLDPQNAPAFTTVPPPVWHDLQVKARHLLISAPPEVHPIILDHWKNMAAGKVPFGYRVEAGP